MSATHPASASSPATQLVVIARFPTPIEAEQAKLVLEAEGIHTFLGGKQFVGMAWYLGTAVGHISVEVAAEDELRGDSVLRAEMPQLFLTDDARISDSDRLECLACRADMTPTQSECDQCGWTWVSHQAAEEPVGFRLCERLRPLKRPIIGMWIYGQLAVGAAVCINACLLWWLQAESAAAGSLLIVVTMLAVLAVGGWAIMRTFRSQSGAR